MAFETVKDLVSGIVDNTIEQEGVWNAIKMVAAILEMDPFAIAEEVTSNVFDISEDKIKDATQGEFDSKTKVALVAVVKSLATGSIKIIAGGGVVGLLFALGDFGKAVYDLYEAAEEEQEELIHKIDGAVRNSYKLLAKYGLNSKNCTDPDCVKNAYYAAKDKYHPRKGTDPNKRKWIKAYNATQFLYTERGKVYLMKKSRE